MELGSAYGKVVLDGSGVRKGISDIKSAFRDGARSADQFGSEISKGVARGTDAIKSQASQIKGGLASAFPSDIGFAIGAGIGGAVVAGLGSILPMMQAKLKEFTDTGVQLGKMQQSTGMAIKDLSALSIIAKENEISTETLNTALARFSRVIADTKGPTANLRTELFALSDQFKSMADGPEKTALAMQMLGRSGEALIPMLNQGGAALDKYAAELERAGVIMDEKMVAAANRMDDAQDKLARTSERLTIVIGSQLVPILANLAEGVDEVSNQSFENMIIKGDLVTQILVRAQLAALRAATGANAAASGFNNAGNSAAGAVGGVLALASAFNRAMSAYNSFRSAESARSAMVPNMASAGAVLGDREEKLANARERQRIGILTANQAMREQIILDQHADRETRRLTNGITAQREASWDTAAALGDFTRAVGGAGGASKQAAADTKELADAQEILSRRTAGIESAMNSSLKPMSEMDKFQQAWAIASGNTTIQELEQEAAVKGVMKALEDKKISQEDALATLVALRQGLLDAKDAMAQTGGSGDQFLKDVDSIRSLTDGAIKKVEDLSIGVNNLPNNKDVRIGIRVVGKDDLMDAHDRMAAMKDRDVTLRVNVVGLQQLRDIGAGLRPVGTPGGFAPGSTTTTPAPAAGAPTTTPAPADDGAKRGTQSVINVNVGGKVVASALVNDQGSVNMVRANKRRSWSNN